MVQLYSGYMIRFEMAGKTPHVVRTALQQRQQSILSACVSSVRPLSPSVKEVTLKADNPDGCYFEAGQWLDLFVPGISHVGGFSMWSPPHEFTDKGTLRLAIKQSEDPVAQWVHDKCTIGDEIRFRFGGDFLYDPETDQENHSLCLIAGGVGVNPLMSILLETWRHDTADGVRRPIVLLQAARVKEELLFLQETKEVAKSNSSFHRSLFVSASNSFSEGQNRRICREDLEAAIEKCEGRTKFFICGPSAMIDAMTEMLRAFHISQEIYFEKWS